jgi:hypothetical protein
VRIKGEGSGEILAVPRPGRRLQGTALGATDHNVYIRLDGARETITVPLSAIGELELSRGRRGSRAKGILTGMLIGFGTFWGAGALAVNTCGLDCDGAILAALAGGVVIGSMAGARLSGERWERVPVQSLSTHFHTP